MATAVSAISESKKKWDGFKETAEKMKEELRENIQSLTETIEEVGEVCKKFHEEYCGKITSESEKMMQLQSDLKQMVITSEKELKKVLSEDVAILFVGRTSSGKSSLINALLQDRRLPVSKVQTTMCKIQVRPTTDKEWSVVKIGCEKPLSDQKSKEDVKALLSKMSGKSKTEERKKLTINSQSVIQVNWPRHLCTLPENIVLIDTAGFKEDHDGDKVILESCKKADILVAVMDCMSPSIKDIADLLNKNCQLKFGVFTKWDKDLQDKEEEEEIKTAAKAGERQQIREVYEQDFRRFVNGKCEVYFVDAKHFTKAKETPQSIYGREDFLRFETNLAQSAKSVKAQKDVAPIDRAKDVTSKQETTFQEIECILEKRRNLTEERLNNLKSEISTLQKERLSLDAVNEEVKKFIDLRRLHLTRENTDRLIKELGNKMEECSSIESEDEAVDKFLEEEIEGINRALQEQSSKIEKEYGRQKDNLRSSQDEEVLRESLPSYEAIELKKAKDSSYRSSTDPYAYVTSNRLWNCMCGGVAATAVFATAPLNLGSVVTAAATVGPALTVNGAEAGGAAAFFTITASLVEKISGVGLGQRMRRRFGPSRIKVNCMKQLARENLTTIESQIEYGRDKRTEMIDQISSEIERREMRDIPNANEELNQLKEWLCKLTESTKRLQEVRNKFDELKHRLRDKDTVPLDDQTENQSPVQPGE